MSEIPDDVIALPVEPEDVAMTEQNGPLHPPAPLPIPAAIPNGLKAATTSVNVKTYAWLRFKRCEHETAKLQEKQTVPSSLNMVR